MVRTKENILKALVYEQAAYYNYRKFADEAKKEGLPEVVEVFQELASQELEHKNKLLSQLKKLVPPDLTRGKRKLSLIPGPSKS
ncbi:ferritin family protein [Heliorestis convoluta]|uniref:Rubrerythrin family protein, putative n=1 Tax=Heliorestis convoluta TaxID=356322 RepID=A0A5Q2N872_9FIRM|nr:ferritin family protein [Heliorestis convoluta]QGG48695.1 rubrerythrin family protein, putative [Heliorestis convoluta]